MRPGRLRGFTLIELMVVLTIIAILLAIMVPVLVKTKYQAQLAGCQHAERALASSMEIYRTDQQVYPVSCTLDANCPLVTGGYMRNTDVGCPSNLSPYTLSTTAAGDNYTISCNGIHSLVLSQVVQGFPQYNGAVGLNPTGP